GAINWSCQGELLPSSAETDVGVGSVIALVEVQEPFAVQVEVGASADERQLGDLGERRHEVIERHLRLVPHAVTVGAREPHRQSIWGASRPSYRQGCGVTAGPPDYDHDPQRW